MESERITVRDVEFVVATWRDGEPAVFICSDPADDGGLLLSRPGDGSDALTVGDVMAELQVGTTVIVAEPITVASNGSSPETVQIAGRSYAVSHFADGMPVVYDCVTHETYGVVCRKHFKPDGSFDALLLGRVLVPGTVIILAYIAD